MILLKLNDVIYNILLVTPINSTKTDIIEDKKVNWRKLLLSKYMSVSASNYYRHLSILLLAMKFLRLLQHVYHAYV